MSERKFKVRQTFDIEEIKKLFKKCMPSDDWYETRNPVIYWLAEDRKGNYVGYCMLTLLPENVCFMSSSGVLHSARGAGLQLKMIRVRERAARKYGYEQVISYTKIDNISSSRNLQKAGYSLYLPEDEYADKDCLYWIKDL